MSKTIRSILTIALCTTLIGAASLSPVALAANPHSNAGGNGNGNGNGNGSGNAGGNGNGNGSVVHQYALASGQSQGQVSSQLKSWNSLNANPKALLNHLNNPNSLLGKEVAYICSNAASQTALTTYEGLTQSTTPPTPQQITDASAYLAAVALLNGADPATVAADPASSPEQVAAANLLIANFAALVPLTPQTAGATVAYGTDESSAQSAFLAASVSHKGATYDSTMSALRTTVDGIIAKKGLDTTTMCTATASVQ